MKNTRRLGRRKAASCFSTLLVALFLLPACGEQKMPDPPAVEGWPPATPLASEQALKSSTLKAAPTGTDTPDINAKKKIRPQPINKCVALVDRACTYLGVYSQECIEARAKAERITRLNQLRECSQIVTTFELTHAKDTRRNPCWVLARRVCEDRGRGTKECKDRRDSVKRLTRESDRQACRGDLLLEEARDILGPTN